MSPAQRPSGPFPAIAAGVVVGLLITLWLSFLIAAIDAPCASDAIFACTGDDVAVFVIGLPVVLVGAYLAMRIGGAQLPSVGVLVLVGAAILSGALLGELSPPVFYWPVAMGALATTYVALSRR
jgi:hypothetical protein